jgi:hypothetical protein
MGTRVIRLGMGSVSAGIAVLAVGFAVKSEGMPVEAGLPVDRAGVLAAAANHPDSFDLRFPVGSQIPAGPDVRVASLETEVDPAPPREAAQPDAPASTTPDASFGDRFAAFFDRQPGETLDAVVFGAPVLPVPLTRALPALATETFTSPSPMQAARVPPPESAKRETARSAISQPAPQAAAVNQPSPPVASQKPVHTADVHTTDAHTADVADDSALPSGPGSRTAIYDISAKVVYLPNGDKLEAHSGLGSNLDDPRSIGAKDRGVTPPNVYELTLRKQLFHGVQAIRLIPADEAKMFGREGMLAHPYMLGPNGQSNGCVSFSNYPAFLNAFLKGEVDRLVVVEHYAGAPGTGTGFGWLPEFVRNLFKSS